MTSVLAASPGERLRTLRELMGLTQAQVSGMSGVASSWISDVENGYRDHDDAKLEQIAKATETPSVSSTFSRRPSPWTRFGSESSPPPSGR